MIVCFVWFFSFLFLTSLFWLGKGNNVNECAGVSGKSEATATGYFWLVVLTAGLGYYLLLGGW